jgi:hypothetical protein
VAHAEHGHASLAGGERHVEKVPISTTAASVSSNEACG